MTDTTKNSTSTGSVTTGVEVAKKPKRVSDKLAGKSEKAAPVKQVRLQLVYLDFWSTIKMGFLLSLIGAIISVVAFLLLWFIVIQLGVLDSIDGILGEILDDGSAAGATVSLSEMLSLDRVAIYSLVFAGLGVICLTALSAVAAVVYNITAKITGGLLVGFSNK